MKSPSSSSSFDDATHTTRRVATIVSEATATIAMAATIVLCWQGKGNVNEDQQRENCGGSGWMAVIGRAVPTANRDCSHHDRGGNDGFPGVVCHDDGYRSHLWSLVVVATKDGTWLFKFVFIKKVEVLRKNNGPMRSRRSSAFSLLFLDGFLPRQLCCKMAKMAVAVASSESNFDNFVAVPLIF